jgi:transcription elongation factor Elf1
MNFDFGVQHILYAIAAICFVILFWFSPIIAVAAAICVAVWLRILWKRVERDLAKRYECPRCAFEALADESATEVYAGHDVIVSRGEIPKIFRCDNCAAWFEKEDNGTYTSITGEVAAELEQFWGVQNLKS